MASITATSFIAAPVEEVFRVFSDLENAAGRIKGIKKIEVLTPGPMGVGSVLFYLERTSPCRRPFRWA